MLETPNWLVVIYSGHQIAEPRDPQYKNALPQEGLAYGCSAIRPPPLEACMEAWILDSLGCPILRADHNVPEAQLRTSRFRLGS